MARWRITISGKNIRKQSVQSLAEKMKEQFGADASISVEDATLPASRQDRWDAAIGLVSDGRSEIESLRDELQEWYESIPENLKSGGKADEVQEAIDGCESAIASLEEVENNSPSFPSMF